MIITLPRGVNIDIDNVPENLEEIMQKTFSEYTHGTAREYTYEDKLMFIDVLMKNLHHADAYTDVNNLIIDRFGYNLEEHGELTEPEEFLSVEFMQECYEAGQRSCKLRSFDYAGERRNCEKIMKIVVRVITAVMNWEGSQWLTL